MEERNSLWLWGRTFAEMGTLKDRAGLFKVRFFALASFFFFLFKLLLFINILKKPLVLCQENYS